MIRAVRTALGRAGSAGMTIAELEYETEAARALIRATLAAAVFVDGTVTVVPGSVGPQALDGKLDEARFRLGDPTAMLAASS